MNTKEVNFKKRTIRNRRRRIECWMKEEFKFPAKASKGRLQQTMIFFDDSLSGQECLSQKKKTTKISQKSMKKGKEKKKNQKKKV